MRVENSGNINFKEVDYDPFSDHDDESIPTTEPQREIWTNIQIGGHAANCAYNESVTLTLEGNFDFSAFKYAVNELLQRHDALRSIFSADGLTFKIQKFQEPEVAFLDFRSLNIEERETNFKSILYSEAEHEFDLEKGPLSKFTVIQNAGNIHQIILTFHHIVCDGWSLGIVMQDLSGLYSSFVKGIKFESESVLSFREFAFEEQFYKLSSESKIIEDFWVNRFKNDVPVLEIPIDKSRPAVRTFSAKRTDAIVNAATVEAIRKTGAKQGCSFVTTLVTAFEIFLHRITQQDDIVVGLPAAGQSLEGKENLVGHAVNLLPLRSKIDSSLSFNQYLKQRKPEILDAYDHQKYTFGSLINRLNIPRDPSRIPLVPVSFNVDIGITNGVKFYGCEYTFSTNPRNYENFEIFINASGSGNNLTLECTYNTDLFEPEIIKERLAEFIVLLNSICLNPEEKISMLEILSPEEKFKLLDEWNRNQLPFDESKCIHQLFEDVVLKSADSIAVVHHEKQITFKTLNERSNYLANLLIAKGAGPEVLIGICMERSIDMIISMYAVLKAGSAYVPVDPSYPVDRIKFILDDAKAPVVISDVASRHLISGEGAEIVCIQDLNLNDKNYANSNPVTRVHSRNQAYNIYTSGSTGKPKGVTIEHKSVVALTAWAKSIFSNSELNGVLGSTTICFDLSIFEIFVTLCLGGRLVLVKDVLELAEVSASAGVTLINTVPSAMSELLKMEYAIPSDVTTVIMCGEPLSVALVNKIYENTSVKKVYDLYGPTEDTVYSTCMLRKQDEPATIGKVIPNSELFLLDKNLQPVPVGVPGEMFLGGAGLARGYLYRPELTAEKFIANPFANGNASRLYKTGDLAKFRADGNIEFLGRIDNQVKVRGFRIELGEIESMLQKHPAIREQVVVAREDEPGEKKIVAYMVLKPGEKPEVSELRAYLKKELPDYMVPSMFIFIDAMPLTPNNKIDRKALPRPEGTRISSSVIFEEPAGEIEITLAAIWCELLGLPRVSRKDNFFELGGHSLIAVRMFNEVQKRLNVKVQLPVIFRAPTIEELAGFLNKEDTGKPWSCLVPLQTNGTRIPLFCIHMHNGNINRWKVLLKHLGNNQPVYAIQPRGLDISGEPHYNIEEMARYYLDIVRSVQPSGPYQFLGLCFSGMVVFEMAALLEKVGEKVSFLGMINNYAPPENPTLFRIHNGINKFLKLEMGEKINYAFEKNITVGKSLFSKAKQLMGSNVEQGEGQEENKNTEVGHDLRTIHSRALLTYNPEHIYHGDVALIRTDEPIDSYFNEHLGWDRLIKGKIETTIINNCDNDTIITDEPYNIILSLKVKEYLDRGSKTGE